MSIGTAEVCSGVVDTIVVLSAGSCSVVAIERVDGLIESVDVVKLGTGVEVVGMQSSCRPVSERGLLQLLHANPLYDRIYSNCKIIVCEYRLFLLPMKVS